MTDDIVAFIRARLDEDAEIAHVARDSDEDWQVSGPLLGGVTVTCLPYGVTVGTVRRVSVEHIARHDPARVLRGVQAKRRLLDEVFKYEAKIDGEWACCHEADEIAAGLCGRTRPEKIPVLRLLASEWSGHEDYRREWAP